MTEASAPRFQNALSCPYDFLDFCSPSACDKLEGASRWGRELANLLYIFGRYTLDPNRRELRHEASLIAVEPQVFDLLEHLIRARERVVSRDELIASVWGGRIVSESALSTRINAARSAIGDSGAEQRLIKTLPRKGVRFVGDVREERQRPTNGSATAAAVVAVAPGAATPAAPYRGLAAMMETDRDFFFGRDCKIVEVIRALVSEPDRLPILLGNSGVGKSSLAQAGVLAALARQGWPDNAKDAGPWPAAFHDSGSWCFLKLRPGTEPLKALVQPFLRTWRFEAADPLWVKRQAEWVQLLSDEKLSLSDLMDATERRHEELQQPKPPAFFLYIDQGEELYVRAEERQRRGFSEAISRGIADPRLYALMSLRSDFLGQLQADEALFSVHCKVDVPPLRQAELREVVSRPAELLSVRFETDHLAADIAERAAADSAKEAGALPLLSYLLDDMWSKMRERGDATLRAPPGGIELGRVLEERADIFLARHPKAGDLLRRVLTLKLATVREDGEPTRRRALRSEFTDDEWALASELAGHPSRLLVIAAPEAGETYAEVAHEAIFRRWGRLREWIAAERGFFAWRSGLETARRAWQAAPDGSKQGALLMGLALEQARTWVAERSGDIPSADREFIALSGKTAQRRKLKAQALVGVLALGVVAGLAGWVEHNEVDALWRSLTITRPFMQAQVRPFVLTAAAERALQPGASFRECATDQNKDYCPEMVVIPGGSFTMGSPPTEKGRSDFETPQHPVTIARPFAVAKFELTFDEWDTCATYGDCPQGASDVGWGRGRRPVINVTWEDARRYVAWLAKMTGKPYRLLTEAEYEYGARAGTRTAYPWGDKIGNGNANCGGCGSQWDKRQTAPVGSFPANPFGLFDMAGNVFEWVEDCVHPNYNGAPEDGRAWIEGGDCNTRVVRGGSWDNVPAILRSADRFGVSAGRIGNSTVVRNIFLGFRVARTLTP
jgi:formylglycine-generating enzyme required for sulfatase activity/DNA-binding winged helix-turn-helix (wHTH) protein